MPVNKSNHHVMNTNEHPPTESAFRPGHNPCFGSDTQIAALNVFADDGHSYLLPYAQFLSAERFSNPALEQEADAPPEKMLIGFASANVLVLGSGLKRLEAELQKYELKFVKSAERRLAATLNTHVATVTIAFTKEKP
jgi:hypothetical protein